MMRMALVVRIKLLSLEHAAPGIEPEVRSFQAVAPGLMKQHTLICQQGRIENLQGPRLMLSFIAIRAFFHLA